MGPGRRQSGRTRTTDGLPAPLRPPSLRVDESSPGAVRIVLTGEWRLGAPLPDIAPLTARLADGSGGRLSFDASQLGRWDTGLLTTLNRVLEAARVSRFTVDESGLPEGIRRLLRLAAAVPERAARQSRESSGFLPRVGVATIERALAGRALLAFLGRLALSFWRLLRRQARFDTRDLLLQLEHTGAHALPIVSLISFLVGVIFAFVGVMQLAPFGAGVYVANLVAVGMVREMAGIMTAIIMAGRTGAAFAAQLGTMKVNEEIDALHVLGINVIDYLVLPRTLALVAMMPLLTLYASLMGVFGGLVAALAMLDLSLVQYIEQTRNALDLGSVAGGLFKSLVYGVMVAVAGCQQGLACGNSAMAVGQATTAAVVMGILLIVVSASVLTVIYTTLGI